MDAARLGSSQLGWEKMATSDSIKSSLRLLENLLNGGIAFVWEHFSGSVQEPLEFKRNWGLVGSRGRQKWTKAGERRALGR